jgi:hypothetical protein
MPALSKIDLGAPVASEIDLQNFVQPIRSACEQVTSRSPKKKRAESLRPSLI